MKTTVKKLFLLSSIAILTLFGAAINALPISFAHLKKDDKEVALIGDAHTNWSAGARFEPPYINAFNSWLPKLSKCQQPIHFCVETRQRDVESKTAHAECIQYKELQDSLGSLIAFLHVNGLKFGSIQFDLADPRTPQIECTATIASYFTSEARHAGNLSLISENGIQSHVIAEYKKEYGDCSLNDFFGEVERVLDAANKQKSTLPEKAQKLMEELIAELSALAEQGKKALSKYAEVYMGPTFFTEPAIDAVARFCEDYPAGSQINPVLMQSEANKWIMPINSSIADVQLYLKFMNDLNHHDFTIGYFGGSHVARLVPFLEALGFITIKREGDLQFKHGLYELYEHALPISADNLKILLNGIVEAANAKKDNNKSESTDVKDNALAQPANPAPNASANSAQTELHQCAQCSKTGQFMRCSRCQAVRYCSPECQKAHWKAGHKESCKKV